MGPILIAVHGFPPRHNAGAERRAARTARSLARLGYTVHVVCVEEIVEHGARSTVSTAVEDGVTVYRLTIPAAPPEQAFRWSYNHPLVGAAVGRLIAELEPSVFHLFSGYLLSGSVVHAAVDAGVPVVVSLTDYWWLCHQINLLTPTGRRCGGPSPAGCARCLAEQQRRFRLPAQHLPALADGFWRTVQPESWLGRQLAVEDQQERATYLAGALRRATALIAPSSFLAGVYRAHGLDAGSQLRVSRQGVELTLCPLRQSDSMLRVGYIGQIKPHKGVDLLLDAWTRLSGPRARQLTLYGSAEGASAYEAQIRSMIDGAEMVTWPGVLRGAEIWDALARLDVLVMPVRWVENSPNVILEAQAMGVPIIGTDLGGVAELVRHNENGLRFASDDASDLARQLQRILDEPQLLTRLRAGAMPFRTVDEEIAELEMLYAELAHPVAAIQ